MPRGCVRRDTLPCAETNQNLRNSERATRRLDQVVTCSDRGGLAPISRAELAEDGANVAAGRARAEEEALRNLGIGETLAQEDEHFLLPEGQGAVSLIPTGGRRLLD